MKLWVFNDKHELIRSDEHAVPVCGEDFCVSCGDCLHCDGEDMCVSEEWEGPHLWVKYEEGDK